jgi:hypothetical protein
MPQDQNSIRHEAQGEGRASSEAASRDSRPQGKADARIKSKWLEAQNEWHGGEAHMIELALILAMLAAMLDGSWYIAGACGFVLLGVRVLR